MRRSLFLLSFLSLVAVPTARAQTSVLVEYIAYGGIGRVTSVKVMSDGRIEHSELGSPTLSQTPTHRALSASELARVRTAMTRAAHATPPPRGRVDADGHMPLSEILRIAGTPEITWTNAQRPAAALAALARLLLQLAPAVAHADNPPPGGQGFS